MIFNHSSTTHQHTYCGLSTEIYVCVRFLAKIPVQSCLIKMYIVFTWLKWFNWFDLAVQLMVNFDCWNNFALFLHSFLPVIYYNMSQNYERINLPIYIYFLCLFFKHIHTMGFCESIRIKRHVFVLCFLPEIKYLV